VTIVEAATVADAMTITAAVEGAAVVVTEAVEAGMIAEEAATTDGTVVEIMGVTAIMAGHGAVRLEVAIGLDRPGIVMMTGIVDDDAAGHRMRIE